MGSVNKFYLTGIVGQDPKVINGKYGILVALRVATSEFAGKDRDRHTEWFNVNLAGNDRGTGIGDIAAEKIDAGYLRKGSEVAIGGKFRTKEGRDGKVFINIQAGDCVVDNWAADRNDRNESSSRGRGNDNGGERDSRSDRSNGRGSGGGSRDGGRGGYDRKHNDGDGGSYDDSGGSQYDSDDAPY